MNEFDDFGGDEIDPLHSSAGSVIRSSTLEDLRMSINSMTLEIMALETMKQMYVDQYNRAKKKVEELEAQFLLEIPNGK